MVQRIDSTPSRVCILLFVLWAATGCSGFTSGESSSSSNSSLGSLKITPAGTALSAGASQQLSASGGKAPYTYSVSTGFGSIDANGMLRIPAGTGNAVSATTVSVVDSVGNQADAQFSISPSVSYSLTATYSPNPAYAGDVVTISVSGGPAGSGFAYTKVSGSGTLNGAAYTTASVADSAVVTVSDMNGVSVQVTIASTEMTLMTALTLSPRGLHTVGGFGCPADRKQVGSLVDAGGSTVSMTTASSDQIFCAAQVSRSTRPSQWIVDAVFTQEGQHIQNGAAACPVGFVKEGDVQDCHGGVCSGQQSYCVKYGSDASAYFVKDIYLTPAGQHALDGIACSDGYLSRGQIEDCGGGTCSGLQNLCAKF